MKSSCVTRLEGKSGKDKPIPTTASVNHDADRSSLRYRKPELRSHRHGKHSSASIPASRSIRVEHFDFFLAASTLRGSSLHVLQSRPPSRLQPISSRATMSSDIAEAEALAAKLPDQLRMAREYAVLGSYDTSLRYFDLCLADLTKFARLVGELPGAGGHAEREKWLAVKGDVASEARTVREIQRELAVFRAPPGSARAREIKAGVAGSQSSSGGGANSGRGSSASGNDGGAGGKRFPFGQAPFGRGVAGEEDGKTPAPGSSASAPGSRASSGGAKRPLPASQPQPGNYQPPPPWAVAAPPQGSGSNRASPNPSSGGGARVSGGGSGAAPGRPSVGGAAGAGPAAASKKAGPGYANVGAFSAPQQPSSRPGGGPAPAAAAGAGGAGKAAGSNKPPLPRVFGGQRQVGKDGHSGSGKGGGSSHDNRPVKGGGGPGGGRRYSDINTNPSDAPLIATIESDLLTLTPSVRWDSIAGLEEAKGLLQEAVVLPMIVPGYFQGIRRPWKGVLLFGREWEKRKRRKGKRGRGRRRDRMTAVFFLFPTACSSSAALLLLSLVLFLMQLPERARRCLPRPLPLSAVRPSSTAVPAHLPRNGAANPSEWSVCCSKWPVSTPLPSSFSTRSMR